MTDLDSINLKVALIDSDYYTEKAIHAYLAWDRRTRALTDYSSLEDFWQSLGGSAPAAYPDVIILDVNNVGERGDLRRSIRRLVDTVDGATLVCLSHVDDLDLFYAAAEGGARAFLHKEDVRFHVASAVCIAATELRPDELLYSHKMDEARRMLNHRHLGKDYAVRLPSPRQYPGLTPRVRRTIELFAIEGMPSALIANELGIKLSSVTDNIKRAYDALGLHDLEPDETFLASLPQRERAFMKLTALEEPRR